jgi:hypothetical protein
MIWMRDKFSDKHKSFIMLKQTICKLPKWPKCLFDYDKYGAKSQKIYFHVTILYK